MYNRFSNNYNPPRRHKRRRLKRNNPTPTSYIATEADSFASISAARAFLLQHSDPCKIINDLRDSYGHELTPAQKKKELKALKKKIKNAKKVIRRANLRNLRRRAKSVVGRLIFNEEFSGERKALPERRFNPEEDHCPDCGRPFSKSFTPETHCKTCGYKLTKGRVSTGGFINMPSQEKYEEAEEDLKEMIEQSLELSDGLAKVQAYISKEAKDKEWILRLTSKKIEEVVEESGEAPALPDFIEDTIEDINVELHDESDEGAAVIAFPTTKAPGTSQPPPRIPVGYHRWERLYDEKGGIVYFEIHYSGKGKSIKMKAVPTVEEDFVNRSVLGDKVLDMTDGLALREVKLNKAGRFQMPKLAFDPNHPSIKLYRTSYLYLVRKLAAGKISHAEFKKQMIKALDRKTESAYRKNRKLKKRKKKKNNKK